jgi:hypothetical protein
MTIKFGKRSIKAIEKGLDLTPYLPDEELMDWVSIDIINRTVEVRIF